MVDTADVKAPVLKWAAELLPKEVHFVGGHPILMSQQATQDEATAGLFENKLFCLTPDAVTDDTAVRLAADLATALGARPFFLDATEHDGMIAAVEHLPQLMAGALLAATGNSASWRDMRRLAGGQFYTGTQLAADDGKEAVSACAANRQHTLFWLDQLIGELSAWRQRLSVEDDEFLVAAFDQGLNSRGEWLRAQISGDWGDDLPSTPIPTSGTMMRDVLGFGPRRTPPVEKPKR